MFYKNASREAIITACSERNKNFFLLRGRKNGGLRMFEGFESRFSKRVAVFLEELFKGNFHSSNLSGKLDSTLAGDICAELIRLPKSAKTNSFLVAKALSRAGQQNPFVDLEDLVFVIGKIAEEKSSDIGGYINLLFDIAKTCNQAPQKDPLIGWNETRKVMDKRAGDNQVYTIEKFWYLLDNWLVLPSQIVSILEFQVSMCFSPHKQAVDRAQEFLKKTIKFCYEYRVGSDEAVFPVQMLYSFFIALKKRELEVNSTKEKEGLCLAINAMAYGIVNARGVVEVASAELIKWLNEGKSISEG
ncbi:MAG: hypothetical protein V1819_00895 [bacterium]